VTQSELPPTDHVARVLLKQGARDAALNLLRAAIARDPGEMACAALLKAVEARPDSSVYGPDMRLDVSMARTYARRGWLLEALALLQGARLTGISTGRELANELREILGPIPDDSPEDLREADAQIRRGGASVAMMTFDEYAATGRALPPWAERRHQLLSMLLLDAAPAARPSSEIHTMTPVGTALQKNLEARDLKGALASAKAYLEKNPSDHNAQAVVVALGRMVEAMGAINLEVDTAAMRTQPMTGVNVALFQTRMCNFDIAERMFRKLVISDPMDELARAHLDDVQTIKKALGAIVAPELEAPARPTVDPLRSTAKARKDEMVGESTVNRRAPDKAPPRREAPQPISSAPILEEPTRRVSEKELYERARESEPEVTHHEPVYTDPDVPAEPSVPNEPIVPVTASSSPIPEEHFEEQTREVQLKIPGGAKKPVTSPSLLKKTGRPAAEGWGTATAPAKPSDWEEVSTEIGDPDQMAELMLKQGYAERALRIYDRLARVYPDRERYARRAEEIRQLIDSGAVPKLKTLPGEDYLSRPDEPESSAETTMGERPIEADPRVPAAGAALDALAPRMDDVPIEVRGSGAVLEVPATKDHSQLRAQVPQPGASPPVEWTEDETTVVGDEHEEQMAFADVDDGPTVVNVSREDVSDIVANITAEDAPPAQAAEAPRPTTPDVTIAETPADGDVIVRRVIAVR